jgi:flagellar secretion chaperone FliS
MNNRPSRRYHAMEIEGLSGPRLVVFVYSHLLAALRQGHRAIGLGDHEARSVALCRARDLMYELVYALDSESGGPLAENLARLYHFYIREIGAVDFHPDAARLGTLIEMVASLQEAWQAAASQLAEAPVPAGIDG